MPAKSDRDRTRGRLLQKCRQKKGFSQEQMAKSIGVTVQTVYNWEKGKSWSQFDNLSNLCRVLGLSTEFLANIDVHCDVENIELEKLDILLKEKSFLDKIHNLLRTNNNEVEPSQENWEE